MHRTPRKKTEGHQTLVQRPKPESVRLARFLTPCLKLFKEPIPQGLRPTPIVEAAPQLVVPLLDVSQGSEFFLERGLKIVRIEARNGR